MSKEIAVSVKNTSKTFKLHNTPTIKTKLIDLFKAKDKTKEQVKKNNTVLKNVSFEVKQGEFFAIIGRNGSGKSTLLKMLAGIYEQDTGEIAVNGKLVPFIELGVGFNQELTGRDNVYLNGALLGFTRQELDLMYEDIVSFAELKDFMNEKLKNYSSGMQVRLAFSIAIRANSDILLIDEVLAVGDALFQQKCFKYFRKLKDQKKTVVFVSHDIDIVKRYCTAGIFLSDGEIVEQGDISEVAAAYEEVLSESYKDEQSGEVVGSKAKIVEITSCKLFVNNTSTNKVKFKDNISFEIMLKKSPEYKVEVVNIALGIYDGLYDSGSNYEIGVNTLFDNEKIKIGDKPIKINFKNPPIKNGTHYVYLSVFADSEEIPLDYIPEVVVFSVSGSPKLTSRGTLITEHSWS